MQDKRFKLLGINDDESTCAYCGRVELKSVMWLEDSEGGEPFAVGRTCGAKLLKMTAKEFKAFEKSEILRHRIEARKATDQDPAFIAFRAKLNEINIGPRLTFAERLEALREVDKAESEARDRISKLFPLAGFIDSLPSSSI